MLFDCPKTPEDQQEIDTYMEKNKPIEQSPSTEVPTPEYLATLREEMYQIKLKMKNIPRELKGFR